MAVKNFWAPSYGNDNYVVQSVLSRLEDKQKLLQQSHIMKTAFVVTADDSLPDDLVTTVQVRLLNIFQT